VKIAFYGSSLLSSWWNGAATYYRGLLRDLASRGYDITFYEPDAYERQQHRDLEPPEWARSVVYPATAEGLRGVLAKASDADIVVKASGVGVFDDELITGIVTHARPGALKIFWDVDAAATLDEMRGEDDHPVKRGLASLDLVLTYGGGPPVVEAYERFGARSCVPIYNALDPTTHHPVDADRRFAADLSCPWQPAARPPSAGRAIFPGARCRPAPASVSDRRQRLGRERSAGQRSPPRPRLHSRA